MVILVGLAAAIGSFGAPTNAFAQAPTGKLARVEAQASALAAKAVAEAHRVHVMAVAYDHDVAKRRSLSRQVAVTRASLAGLRSKVWRTEAVVRRELVLAYADALPTSGASSDQGQSMDSFVAQSDEQTLVKLVAGDLADNIDRYQEEAGQLADRQQSLSRDLVSVSAVAVGAARSRTEALADAANVEHLLALAREQVVSLKAQARLDAQRQALTGAPVGNGLVDAVTQQMANEARTGPANGQQTAVDGRAAGSVPAGASGGRPQPATGSSLPAPTTTAPVTKRATTRPATTTGPATTVPTTTGPTTTGPTTTVPSTTIALATTTTTSLPPLIPPTTVPATTGTTVASTTVPISTPATTVPTSTPPATAGDSGHPPPLGGVWLELRECESGNDYQADTGNGFYGAYQFAEQTWADLGYPGRPDLEPYWMQDQGAETLEAQSGWGQWPECSAALGL